MGSNYAEKIIIKVGGSLIVPNGGINTDFLKNLNKFVREQLAKNSNRQFFLEIGGGATARHYRDAGKEVIGELTGEDLDWLGIHATRITAHLVRTIFHDIAHPNIIEHYDIIQKASEQLVIASGWKPGWSSDYCAALLCEDYGSSQMIKLTRVDYVFTADPNIDSSAQPIKNISWEDFRKLVGYEWRPGMNAPFDPIAAKKSQELGLKVAVLNGNNFENLNNFIEGKEFIGTTIE